MFFFRQKTAYEMRISDWSSDVCSSDLIYQVETPDEVSGAVGEIAVLDHGSLARGAWDIGQSGAASGRAVIEWIRLAEQLARNGEIDGWIMAPVDKSEEHTSELQSLMRISYAVFCMNKKKIKESQLTTSTI